MTPYFCSNIWAEIYSPHIHIRIAAYTYSKYKRVLHVYKWWPIIILIILIKNSFFFIVCSWLGTATSGIRNDVKDCKTTFELVHWTLVHDVRHRLSVTADAQWVVSITPCTGGDWLHIAQLRIDGKLTQKFSQCAVKRQIWSTPRKYCSCTTTLAQQITDYSCVECSLLTEHHFCRLYYNSIETALNLSQPLSVAAIATATFGRR